MERISYDDKKEKAAFSIPEVGSRKLLTKWTRPLRCHAGFSLWQALTLAARPFRLG